MKKHILVNALLLYTLVVNCSAKSKVSSDSSLDQQTPVYFPIIPEDFKDFGVKIPASSVTRKAPHRSDVLVTTPKITTTTDRLPIAREPHAYIESSQEQSGESYLLHSEYYLDGGVTTNPLFSDVNGREKEYNILQVLSPQDSDAAFYSELKSMPDLSDFHVSNDESEESKETNGLENGSSRTTKKIASANEPTKYTTTTEKSTYTTRRLPQETKKNVKITTKKEQKTYTNKKSPNPSTLNFELSKENSSVVLRPVYNPIPTPLPKFEPSKIHRIPSSGKSSTSSNPIASEEIKNKEKKTNPESFYFSSEDIFKDPREPQPSAPKHQYVSIDPVTSAPVQESLIYRTSTKAYRPPTIYRQSASSSKESVTAPSQLEFVQSGNNIYVPQEYDQEAIPGVAGVDYPTYSGVPESSFNCNDQTHPGLYADQDTKCQVFHICQQDTGRQDSFLCPNGTVFNQQYFVCDWWYNFSCEHANRFYYLNALLYELSDADNYEP